MVLSGHGSWKEGPFRPGSRWKDVEGADKSWKKAICSWKGQKALHLASGALGLAPVGVTLCHFIIPHARGFLCVTLHQEDLCIHIILARESEEPTFLPLP